MKLSSVLDFYLPDTVFVEMWVNDDRTVKNHYPYFKYDSSNWNKIYLYKYDISKINGSDIKNGSTYTTVCEIDTNLQISISDDVVTIYYPDRPTYFEYLKFYKKQLISLKK